ncbi:MAG: efflux RND transporter periplasmic adaptor subunit [Methylovulum sp.]|nr:efflux RND transporter periplasmic adaptor subunit [Methylovulum sp.]
MLPSNRLKIILPLTVLLAGTATALGLVAYKPQLQEQTPVTVAPLVSVIIAEPQTLRLDVLSQGVVTPRTEIDLVPEVAGKLIQLHPGFFSGGFFAKNDVLLTIDPRDYDYAITEADARIAEANRLLISEQAQAEQARNEWRTLGDGKPTPLAMREPQLAEARAKLKAAEAELAKARLNRSRCELRAPFAGRVHEKQAGLGQYVQPGEKLARIYSTDAAEIRLPLATDQLAFLDLPLGIPKGGAKQGPKVTLTAEFAGTLATWEGRIVRTEGVMNEASGQLYAVAEVVNPYTAQDRQPPLLAGLFVKAVIHGKQQQNLFALPQSAITVSHNAFLVDAEQHVHIRKLEVLRNEPERVLVQGGLRAGDKVVSAGIQVPVEGMKVRIDTVIQAAKSDTP